jgi:hypothetical protein
MWLLRDLGARSEELRSEISTENLRDLPRLWDWTTGSQSPLRVYLRTNFFSWTGLLTIGLYLELASPNLHKRERIILTRS